MQVFGAKMTEDDANLVFAEVWGCLESPYTVGCSLACGPEDGMFWGHVYNKRTLSSASFGVSSLELRDCGFGSLVAMLQARVDSAGQRVLRLDCSEDVPGEFA